MGEVYRARDQKLGRDVALKILPTAFTGDVDRIARFQREGQVLASLNHPNIAAIYGVEDAGGIRALVLELVDGPTLADRLTSGPLPLDEALPFARQMAEALEAAHGQDIIHRDLKPANVKLRPDGTVKILDFGLAKALDPASAGAAVSSPTITSPALTQMGVILGTAAYMSPEQAKGRPADRRSDIWSLGCVLFEMVTGKRAFEGEDVADTLAFVLTREPAWSALPPVPPALGRLLRRSLAKNPKERLADAADARLDIEEALSGLPLDVGGAIPKLDRNASALRAALPWALTALAITAAGLAWWKPWQTSPLRQPVRLSAELGADVRLSTDPGGAIALSRDGTMLAFSAHRSIGEASAIYVRHLDQLEATLLPGTEDGFAPFFSPDGQSIGFFANGKLRKTATKGGSPFTICDAPQGRGGAWAEDGTIVFAASATGGVLLRVPSTGGTPEAVTELAEGERTHRWPQLLPGDRAVLYTASTTGVDFDNASLVVQPLPSGPRKVLRQRAYAGRLLRDGHLLYVFERTLFAAHFDLDRLELSEPALPVVNELSALERSGGAQFAVSNEGVLAYFHGLGTAERPMSWLDRTGKTTPLGYAAATWTNVRFDPDGRRVAFDVIIGKDRQVWSFDWERGAASKITDAAEDLAPVWSPRSGGIAFASRRDGAATQVYWRRSDGTGEVQRLTDGRFSVTPRSWHPSGKFLAVSAVRRPGDGDILILPLEGDETSGWKSGPPTALVESTDNEAYPEFSPDGRWIAYVADRNDRPEVYVQAFPGPGERIQISSNGGEQPTWSRTRNQLMYSERVSGPAAARRLMVVTYTLDGGSFRPAKPQPWSDALLVWQPGRFFDLHPDGTRVVIADVSRSNANSSRDTLTFVFNFFDELRRMTTPAR